jgi:hypothetical protein
MKSKTIPPEHPEKDPGFRNIAQWILLIAVLVGAWFLLDWLMNGF